MAFTSDNLIGLIKWFDVEKGFGVIETPENGEFFLHRRNYSNDSAKLKESFAVVFTPNFDEVKQRNIAIKASSFDIKYNWEFIYDYWVKLHQLADGELKSLTNKGTLYDLRFTATLIDRMQAQVFEGKRYDDILDFLKAHFNGNQPDDCFISLCEFTENGIVKYQKDISEKLLHDIFEYFGTRLNATILFKVWKAKKFKYIGYDDANDYEIPEEVLSDFKEEIGINELKRLSEYSFGKSLYNKLIEEKFKDLALKRRTEILELYVMLPQLPFSIESNKIEKLRNALFIKIVEESKITIENNVVDVISTYEEFLTVFGKLKRLIPDPFDRQLQGKLLEELKRLCLERCSDNIAFELWLNGFIPEISQNIIESVFLNEETTLEIRARILSRATYRVQIEMFDAIGRTIGRGYQLELLLKYLNLVNSGSSIRIWKNILTVDFKGVELYKAVTHDISKNATIAEKIDFYKRKLFDCISGKEIIANLEMFNDSEIEDILDEFKTDSNFTFELLYSKLSFNSSTGYEKIYNWAVRFLPQDKYEQFDKCAFQKLTGDEYFILWENGSAKILPEDYLNENIEDFYSGIKIRQWVKRRLIPESKLISILWEKLDEQPTINTRIDFYNSYNCIHWIVTIDETQSKPIEALGNSFFNCILWVLGLVDYFDFDTLKSKFVYFSGRDQVKIIRKLFYFKATGKFDLTVERLNELSRIDIDLYKINQEYNAGLELDISTDVIIQTLLSFKKTNHFLVESELIKIVLDDLKHDKIKRFKLSSYFEECEGRLEATYNWKNKRGEARNDDNEWKISFEYSPELVNEIKTINGRRYEADSKEWTVPASSKSCVLEFCRKNKFYIDDEGGSYSNNFHLAEFKREKAPTGILFCEGRPANKIHATLQREFWWCNGEACFQNCETIHNTENWEQYTLLDFCRILEFDLTSTTKVGDTIFNGKYYEFIGLINRFNRLVEKLYCRDCNEILYPAEIAYFARYNVVKFQCQNEHCTNREIVYLNNCLNGKCNAIIDSRESKQCPNGLYICESCGSCCSQAFFQRRLSALETTDNFDNQLKRYIYNDTKSKYDNKLGHLERAEYYCHKCGKEMTETISDVFICKDCSIKYDTTSYRFKRPNRHLNGIENPR